MTNITPSTTIDPGVAVDGLIARRLPAWLRQASAAQINRLRDRFQRHQSSQAKARKATLELMPLQTFAQKAFTRLLGEYLPADSTLDSLQWLDVRREFGQGAGSHWPFYRPRLVRQPGLLRLMQNFSDDEAVLQGSGLVRAGEEKVLSGDPQRLARACRNADVGRLFQDLLVQVFTPATCALLAEDKRSALLLMGEIAALKGEIGAQEQMVLQDLGHANADQHDSFLRGYPGLLTLLGCSVADAMVVNLRDRTGANNGVILYLPSDSENALRHYRSWPAMERALLAELRRPGYRQAFSQLIAMEQRPAFLATLGKRLGDDMPDLEVEGHTVVGDIFDRLVEQQVARVKSDARLLLVPTAEADQKAADARLQVWSGIGLGLANLAGLFIPTVGAMLLGLLVVQTLSQVFEGAVDWYHGHQYEALEHMLGVAETLAVTAALAGGASVVARGFARSAFVDGLHPVNLGEQGDRLWSYDLAQYAQQPQDSLLQADGLYGQGQERWLRIGQRFFQLRRAGADGPWRLRHPLREGAYGPLVEAVGDRGWRLRLERPLEWQGEARMLDVLWPQHPPVSVEQARQILRIADIDVEALRGILVEGRHLPANLADTLLRFQADRRVTAFFTALADGQVPADDGRIQAWCLALPGMTGLEAGALRRALLQRAVVLREQLFEALSQPELSPDALRDMLVRDFPRLPVGYAQQALEDVGVSEREVALAQAKVPLILATKVHSLLQLARLNRAIEGLYLDNAYCNETGELALALLSRLPGWTGGKRLVLREGSIGGRVIKAAGIDAIYVEHATLVRHDGEFQLYDGADMLQTTVGAAPLRRIEAAIIAALPNAERNALGVAGDDGASALRRLLQGQLPEGRSECLQLLGWHVQPRWLNPGRRMADGRVGYPLSGGGGPGPSSWRVLRERLRALYPGLTDTQLEAQLELLLQAPESAYRRLLALEDDYNRLGKALDTWVRAASQGSAQTSRRGLAERLRRAWRRQGELNQAPAEEADSQSLQLSGPQLRSLPVLVPPIDFPAITELVIRDTALTQIPVDFLRCFGALRKLNLTNNQLLGVPRGIAHLGELRRLQLSRNNLRLDRDGIEVLNGLRHLRSLDLSHNPLGAADLSFGHLQHLVSLNLRNCRLNAWPEGIHLCADLERGDLRDNRIERVPGDILKMPSLFRRAFLVERNPMSSVELCILYAMDTVMEHLHLPERVIYLAPAANRAHWLKDVAPADLPGHSLLWDTLEALPGSKGLFRLLGRLSQSAQQANAAGVLAQNVWRLLETVNADSDLRAQVYGLASEPLGCQNGVSDCFSELLRLAAIARAQDRTLHERGTRLMTLGQGLFRLERLEQFARDDIRQRLEARESVDQLALRLYYRVHLRVRLDLPFQPSTMAYAEAAQVDDDQLQRAVDAVRAAQTVVALSRDLAGRTFWQRYIRERHPAPFEVAEQAHLARQATLEQRADTLAAQDLEREREALRLQRDAHDQDLLFELTRQMVYGRERGQA
ncbi:TPA: NEL-type E3 ubiquitin ligase domain-containing protein [Pseudomonas putida]